MMTKDSPNAQWTLLGKTEMINDDLNPDFETSFHIDYFFERNQYLLFKVEDDDGKRGMEFIGSHETELAKIFGAPQQTYTQPLLNPKIRKPGILIIRTDVVKGDHSEVRMTLKIDSLNSQKKCFGLLGRDKPFVRLSRKHAINDGDQSYVKIYESPNQAGTINPEFPLDWMSTQRLCNGDLLNVLKIEIMNFGRNSNYTEYGTCITSLDEILSGHNSLPLTKGGNEEGHLTILNPQKVTKPTIADFIRSGWTIAVACAIDFTASNGEISSPTSLHYLS